MVGWHRDNFKTFAGDPPIATVSLGAVRRFDHRDDTARHKTTLDRPGGRCYSSTTPARSTGVTRSPTGTGVRAPHRSHLPSDRHPVDHAGRPTVYATRNPPPDTSPAPSLPVCEAHRRSHPAGSAAVPVSDRRLAIRVAAGASPHAHQRRVRRLGLASTATQGGRSRVPSAVLVGPQRVPAAGLDRCPRGGPVCRVGHGLHPFTRLLRAGHHAVRHHDLGRRQFRCRALHPEPRRRPRRRRQDQCRRPVWRRCRDRRHLHAQPVLRLRAHDIRPLG